MKLRRSKSRALGLFVLSTSAVGVTFLACSSDPTPTPSAAGAGGVSGAAAAGAPAVAGGGAAGAAVGTGGGGAGTAAAGAGFGGGAGATGGSGSAGAGIAGAGTAGTAGTGGQGVAPTCLTPNVAFGVDNATNHYIECDFEKQAIEFDFPADFTPGKGPGYDPSLTKASFTDYGMAFTGSAVQQCHPFCWKGNLTVGINFTPGSDASTRGEVLFDFPPDVAPIMDAPTRNTLGWIWVDGPALPAGATLTAQLVLKSATKGVILSKDKLTVMPQHGIPANPALEKWYEFKHFNASQGFNAADLVNITAIGFRLTLTPNTAGAWSGVVYADHFELRK